jgi:hypothetical protein
MVESEAYKRYTSRQAWRDFGLQYPHEQELLTVPAHEYTIGFLMGFVLLDL